MSVDTAAIYRDIQALRSRRAGEQGGRIVIRMGSEVLEELAEFCGQEGTWPCDPAPVRLWGEPILPADSPRAVRVVWEPCGS